MNSRDYVCVRCGEHLEVYEKPHQTANETRSAKVVEARKRASDAELAELVKGEPEYESR